MTTKSDLAKKWLGKLTRLNPASGRGPCRGKAPHKPLLLLSLIDMTEAGELTARTFTRTASLVLRFKEYGALAAPTPNTSSDTEPFMGSGEGKALSAGGLPSQARWREVM